jgi:hypothetical protein
MNITPTQTAVNLIEKYGRNGAFRIASLNCEATRGKTKEWWTAVYQSLNQNEVN